MNPQEARDMAKRVLRLEDILQRYTTFDYDFQSPYTLLLDGLDELIREAEYFKDKTRLERPLIDALEDNAYLLFSEWSVCHRFWSNLTAEAVWHLHLSCSFPPLSSAQ
jgi:hypothetical protein